MTLHNSQPGLLCCPGSGGEELSQHQPPELPPNPQPKKSESLRQQSYFHWTNAFNLFMPSGSNMGDFDVIKEGVLAAIDERIVACVNGIACWWTVVLNGKEGNTASAWEQSVIVWKCQYMLIALNEARKGMGRAENRARWKEDCCQAACDMMNLIQIDYATHRDSVMRWHRHFKDSGNKFPHPNPQVAAERSPDPPFFAEYPHAKLAIIKRADEMIHFRLQAARPSLDSAV